jgi:hypothetical protein
MIVLLSCLSITSSSAVTNNFNINANYAFTPLHTYFLATAADGGNDSNSGTDTAHPWLTPNHSVVCGDVILAKPSTSYAPVNFVTGKWGTVSGCPSTTGGIDGAGGINFVTLLCAGTFPGACAGTIPTAINPNYFFFVSANNWAVEGWTVTAFYTTTGAGFCYAIDGTTTKIHHVAFINDICSNAASATFVQDNGVQSTTIGGDYWAVIGMIAQNAAGRCDGFWDAALDIIGIVDWDTNAGTHILFDQNFAFPAPQSASGCNNGSNTDGEAMMFDTLDAHAYSQRIVARNNILGRAEKFGMQIFYAEEAGPPANGKTPVLVVYNNTLWNNNVGSNSTSGGGGWCNAAVGDINIQMGGVVNVTVINNIALTVVASPNCGAADYALLFGGAGTTGVTIGGTGVENILKGHETSCGGTCDAGNNEIAFNGLSIGTDIYVDPAFNNTTDFLNNQMGVPNCSAFTNTVACMGWNHLTQTAINPSVIYDMTATCAQCVGKGYQPPPRQCAADSDYPPWLKGINYLTASGWTNGATIVENWGLSAKPCGL